MIYYQIIRTGSVTKYEYISLNLKILLGKNVFYDCQTNLIMLKTLDSYTKESSPLHPDTYYKIIKE